MGSRSGIRSWVSDKKNWKKIILPALILLALFIAGRLIDLHQYLQAVQDWVWRLGPWGPFAFGVIYVVGMLLLLPGTPFTMLAALLFGTLWGYVTMLTATSVAAALGFFIARYFAKGFVEKHLMGQEAFELVKGWVEENRWLAIPFVRIMPVFPFSLNNYALGLTSVPFWIYLVASEIVFIPMTAVLVLGASALYTAMIRGEFSWGLTLGTIATGVAVLLVGLYGKRTFMNNNAKNS